MIGILGGTFDPIHYGHLRTALEVQQQLSLSQVRFIPCGEPPHRNKPLAEPLQRLAMVRTAIAEQGKFVIDAREITRQGPSYMVDTLSSLKEDFKNESLVLLLGTDAFNGLNKWHRWEQIFDFAHVVVMQRPCDGQTASINKTLLTQIKSRIVDSVELDKITQGKVSFLTVTQLDISATEIRKQWQQGRDIQFLLPDAVLKLIQQQNIY